MFDRKYDDSGVRKVKPIQANCVSKPDYIKRAREYVAISVENDLL